ncbi:hypothetical protein BpHYR1_006575 [Brachionus plicatilis]|uniref:Uncharacterized protein n=1 Tax=Brachionus plicatilis TaxID=10195 RepID=A0A3M7QD09_BRAPC|nr:hypothetical protein BpHYR1_006575 [Brachionus plicatilis]
MITRGVSFTKINKKALGWEALNHGVNHLCSIAEERIFLFKKRMFEVKILKEKIKENQTQNKIHDRVASSNKKSYI